MIWRTVQSKLFGWLWGEVQLCLTGLQDGYSCWDPWRLYNLLLRSLVKVMIMTMVENLHWRSWESIWACHQTPLPAFDNRQISYKWPISICPLRLHFNSGGNVLQFWIKLSKRTLQQRRNRQSGIKVVRCSVRFTVWNPKANWSGNLKGVVRLG